MAQEPGRRAFLQFVAAAGGAALLSACTDNGTTTAAGDSAAGTRSAGTASAGAQSAGSTPSPQAVSGPPTSADWAALARDLSGSLVRPGEADYTTAKRLFDPRFDYLNPAGVAYCEGPHDVSACLAFVRKYGVPVAPRCGGGGRLAALGVQREGQRARGERQHRGGQPELDRRCGHVRTRQRGLRPAEFG